MSPKRVDGKRLGERVDEGRGRRGIMMPAKTPPAIVALERW
jgi:hypothetical protein